MRAILPLPRTSSPALPQSSKRSSNRAAVVVTDCAATAQPDALIDDWELGGACGRGVE
jgi:hypothetical protein